MHRYIRITCTKITLLTHVQIANNYMQSLGGVGAMHIFSPIMLALCLMLFSTYYAHNYAGIIGTGLPHTIATVILLINVYHLH